MTVPAPESSEPPVSGVAHTLALLHPWIDFVPRQQRRLGLFICFALAVHVAAFFFIRIDSTRAELRNPARIHVTVESSRPSAGLEEGDAFLDRLTDPRLFLLPAVPLTRLAAAETAPDLSEMNLSDGPLDFPSAAPAETYAMIPSSIPSLPDQVAAALHPARQAFFYTETVPPPATKTVWQWDPDLAARRPSTAPQLPSAVSDTDLSPTQLRLAISPEGAVEHVLIEQTSQRPELDQQAILAARKLRFPAVSQPGLLWAQVGVFWHCTAPPREVVLPTPPAPATP